MAGSREGGHIWMYDVSGGSQGSPKEAKVACSSCTTPEEARLTGEHRCPQRVPDRRSWYCRARQLNLLLVAGFPSLGISDGLT